MNIYIKDAFLNSSLSRLKDKLLDIECLQTEEMLKTLSVKEYFGKQVIKQTYLIYFERQVHLIGLLKQIETNLW